MKVREIMTKAPVACSPWTNLAAVAELMWVNSCGILPLVDENEKVVGVVTDRDICIALGTRDRRASELTAGEVSEGRVFSCNPEEEAQTALETMRQQRVRRLPAIDQEGKLAGILSMDDVVRHAEMLSAGKTTKLSCENVIKAFREIAEPRPPHRVGEEIRQTKVWR